jgi:hypothetical protein
VSIRPVEYRRSETTDRRKDRTKLWVGFRNALRTHLKTIYFSTFILY